MFSYDINNLHFFQVRGFAPIGMMEYWSIGIMGFCGNAKLD